jgi:hypothetical protein
LPKIVAGDYHALYILQNLVGSDKLELKPLQKGGKAGGEELKGNIVFLCSPQANPALYSLAPDIKIGFKDSKQVDPLFDGIDLPCWFAREKNGDGDTDKCIKKIWIRGDEPLGSPVQKDYDAALNLDIGDPYLCEVGNLLKEDYGILMRLTEPTRKVVVMAGIHQYGTWIVADFFEKLVLGETVLNEKYKDRIEDFIAIIWGRFQQDRFTVNNWAVFKDYCWKREGGKWVKLDDLIAKYTDTTEVIN